MTTITNISGTVTANVTNAGSPSQRMTVNDLQNPRYPRNIILTEEYLLIKRPDVTVAYPVSELLLAAIAAAGGLTWAPKITNQPANASVAAPAATNFSVTAIGENGVTLSYQWQLSTDNGGNWSNLSNAGVYSNVGTNHVNISNSTGLNLGRYRCVAASPGGSNTSNAGILTVT